MCLAIPAEVIEVSGMVATIDVGGARREVNLLLLNEPVGIGQYVLVHAGFAIQTLDKQNAEETLALFRLIAGQEL
jgi:hydrogenase expression/formation protein HypC